jgi:Domain of unknown function (DUF4386)
MASDRKTAIAVGTLFVSATVASILGSLALGSLLDPADYLTGLAADESRIIVAALLFVVAAASAVATAFLLFPILSRHAAGLATGYVVFRVFENVFYVAGVVGLLVMLTVSQSDVVGIGGESTVLLGTMLLSVHDWSILIGTLVFAGLGGMTLNYVLYRSLLVPRWLSLWGLLGAVLLFGYGLLGMFGADTGLGSPFMLLAMPIALQEMVFAGWLIARGFDRRPVQAARVVDDRVAAMS